MELVPEFVKLTEEYLTLVLNSKSENKGWKIPETMLVYPWIIKMFPDIKYIQWVRDPKDCILNTHKTDDIYDFGIDYPETDNIREQRAYSWKYQRDLMKNYTYLTLKTYVFSKNSLHTLKLIFLTPYALDTNSLHSLELFHKQFKNYYRQLSKRM